MRETKMKKSRIATMLKLPFITVMLLGTLLSACATPNSSQSDKSSKTANLNSVAPFPEAKAGYTRYVVNVPKKGDEDNFRVELIIGKNSEVDCNLHKLAGTIKKEELQGWGYYYYVVEGVDRNNGMVSTMMACPTTETKTEFVTLNHSLAVLDYNSKLPIVVYAPSDLQVKYQIWTVKGKAESAVIE
ncbi:serine protease inhibitor ecotin [Orbaceae bacterium ESL0721]|nr:serine protease inhibitor ecotin [Orbaceae bacterium ESL0721]